MNELFWPVIYGISAIVVLLLIYAAGIIRYVGNNRVAIVEKLWSGKGSIDGGFIALAGEAGFQPDVLRGGFHFFFPFQYRVHITLVRLVIHHC